MKPVLTNLKKVVAAIAIILPMAQVSNAIEYRFKFKVTSSGPDIYACNAGMRTKPINCDACYKELADGTKIGVPRPPDCSATATDCNSGVKCISRGINQGENYMNYFKAGKRTWTDHQEALSASTPVTIQSVPNTYSQVVPDSQAMDTKIHDLLFSLGNEAYNAEYFVDICYRAPQLPYAANGINANFDIETQANSTDFISVGDAHGDSDRTGIVMLANSAPQRYTQLAGVKVKSYVVCDLQGQGVLQNSTNSSGVYNTSENEANFVLGGDGLPTAGQNGSFFTSSDLKSLTGDALNLVGTSASNLRFCKIRYVFTETAGLTCSNPQGIFRNWKSAGAEMCTHTTINEPAP